MSEINIDLYFTKLVEIIEKLDDLDTTAGQLTALISQLDTINDNIDVDFSNISLPTTLIHLRKLILFEVEININSNLHSNLLNFIDNKTKRANIEPEHFLDLEQEFVLINEVVIVVKNIINSCNCMHSRANIINKY